MTALETDYLVVGAGAAGMAFVDEIVTHTAADVVLVDRRDQPGGHWNDAYPFVRLHLPSAVYGVNSRPLGEDRLEDHGPNAGMYERATGSEIREYYSNVLREQFLPTGRVRFLGGHEFGTADDRGFRVTSRTTGESRDVVVRRRLVDATYLETSVPATHTRPFAVEDEVRCVPISALPPTPERGIRHVVIGAGKTGIDACLWLLEHDVPAAAIRWIRPRDPWLLDRERWQPLQLLPATMEGLALDLEALTSADSVDEVFDRLESCGRMLRIDPRARPAMYHCAMVDRNELERLRTIEDSVRLGHVRRIRPEDVVLEHGVVEAGPADLYIDCSASGLRRPPERPIFEDGRITLQQVRYCSPAFNAALIGYVEATRTELATQNRLCPVSRYPDVPRDWLQVLGATMLATNAWRNEPDLLQWLEASRLNLFRGVDQFASDPRMSDALQRYLGNLRPAMGKLRELLVPPQPTVSGAGSRSGPVRAPSAR